uniref:Uncharacterized protein n=1 Tax=Anguilla anguilla TaxID=7936 RepID=A0A0E9PMV3_ANGAN
MYSCVKISYLSFLLQHNCLLGLQMIGYKWALVPSW